MTNTQYIEKILASVERIIVDTSTIMTRGFQQFIINNRERLLAVEKKIIVPKAVYSELARHVESENPEKSGLAMAAVELLALNKAIFQVENEALTEETAHAFADAQLLADLTIHRSDCNQLLITNDRKLSCDAYDLNQQQSCKGCRVLVCYINGCGELQCCDCARPTADRVTKEPVSTGPEERTHTTTDVPMKETAENNGNGWSFDWRSGLVSVSGLCLLYGLYKGGRVVLRNMV